MFIRYTKSMNRHHRACLLESTDLHYVLSGRSRKRPEVERIYPNDRVAICLEPRWAGFRTTRGAKGSGSIEQRTSIQMIHPHWLNSYERLVHKLPVLLM